MTNTTLIRIGNSTGVVIPAKILKSLSLSVKDKVSIGEENGRITLRKIPDNTEKTPFSALDSWCSENGYERPESIDDALDYIARIRSIRCNKDIPQW